MAGSTPRPRAKPGWTWEQHQATAQTLRDLRRQLEALVAALQQGYSLPGVAPTVNALQGAIRHVEQARVRCLALVQAEYPGQAALARQLYHP